MHHLATTCHLETFGRRTIGFHLALGHTLTFFKKFLQGILRGKASCKALGLLWRKDHDHLAPFHPGLHLYLGLLLHGFQDFLQNLHAKLRLGDLTSPKEDPDLDLITISEETLDVSDFGLQIVDIGLGTDLDLLYLHRRLLLAGLFHLFGLLVEELAIVHDTADRRIGLGRHLHQIQTLVSSQRQGLFPRNYAHLFAIGVNQTDLWGSNTFVDPKLSFVDLGHSCSLVDDFGCNFFL